MAKIHSIKRRIKSVKNIHQITKAMELVAASKLRRAQDAALRSRLYARSLRSALGNLHLASQSTPHPLFASRPLNHETLVVFTSDRGLAGAYNSNIFKAVIERLAAAHQYSVIVIGQRGAQFLARLRDRITIDAVYTNWPTQPSATDIRPIAHAVTENFLAQKTDQVTLIYTDFISLAQQRASAREILPLRPPISEDIEHDIVFEPSPKIVLAALLPRIIEVQLYQASLEATASEQSMRMIAMKNASDNAEDLNADLTLTYNGARQSAITQELAEIISGAEVIS